MRLPAGYLAEMALAVDTLRSDLCELWRPKNLQRDHMTYADTRMGNERLCHKLAMYRRWPAPRENWMFNTLRPRQNGRNFADDTFKRIFVNENVRILIEISLKFVPKGPINNIPALFQIMAWRRPGDKPLSEPMIVCLPTHICVTRPQWVKSWTWWGCHMSQTRLLAMKTSQRHEGVCG